MSLDRLIEKIEQTQNPSVAGLDPKLAYVPEFIKEKCFEKYGETLKGAAKALLEFNKGLIDALYDIVPAVKPQAAYYEMYGPAGVKTLYKTQEYARSKGMYVITDGKFIPYYGNTIVYSIIGTVCALLFSALLAYPLSKAELYGGKAINKFIIFTMYFGGGMIPNYILMVSLGLRDTVASFILPGMISTYYVILMRSFFLTLPRELEEAGEIDGLDLWGVFWRIAIPLSKPIIATMTLFYVVQYWNDWFDAFLYLDTTTKWPVAYYLRQLISSASGTSADAGDAMQIASNIKSCAMVLTSAPIICIYPFIQKYFVQGMMLGGVKG